LIAEESSILSIKIADRLNDLRNIKQFSLNQRKKIASESLHIYAAIAGRLGIYNWRYEMEDICFKILYKNKAITLQKKFDNYAKLDNLCIEKTKEFLKKKFKYRTINIKLESRIKPLYSTYRKMILKKRKFSELTDRLAIRIITLKIEDCYKALHIVHKYFHQIP
jgi:GTP pyrophosphokinase